MQQPTHRKLRGYAFDPSFSSTIDRRQGNEVLYKVRWEDLDPGPCGEYLEIIDYDPSRECLYEPVDLEHKYALADQGLPLSEGDPRFHQQQVYAVAMSVIQQFERALGRKIIWTRLLEEKRGTFTYITNEFVPKLRIYPHALRQQNAYYSPAKMALLFGYFQASEQWSGNNVPGSTIFTCLSPDIVAHEITHAILDSLHPYLRNDTNPDMLAFHEGFADIIALLQRFTFRTVVEDQIRYSKGDLLSAQNLLGDLAIQFGQAVSSNRRALRSYLVEPDENGKPRLVEPDVKKYRTETDSHSRGALLVAAVFDAFVRLYRYKVADLIRLATNGTGILGQGDIDPDLVSRLAAEACEISNKLMLVCIKALDYCPPLDLNFGDYLRALITADLEHNSDDEEGLRFALLESFRAWGIVPKDVTTYSVNSLVWKPFEEYHGNKRHIAALKNAFEHTFGTREDLDTAGDRESNIVVANMERILRENDREKLFINTQVLAAHVHNIFDVKFQLYVKNVEKLLGMNFGPIRYEFEEPMFNMRISLRAKERRIFQVYKCRPLIRHNTESGNPTKLLIITFVQKVLINLRNSPYEEFFPVKEFAFRGGSTLIIDLSTFEFKYAIIKNVASANRLRDALRHAVTRSSEGDNSALLMHGKEPFAALHLH
jgi:hypothetical protein